MKAYTKSELEQALATMTSLLKKCEKAQEKLVENTAQYTLMKNRIFGLQISCSLIEKALLDS